ncbi:MAG: TRAP transporter substrate-binding protein [Cellvibrionaceae bacterium]
MKSTTFNKITMAAAIFLGASQALTASAATKWNMPTPYADGVHHTKNIREFAADVAAASGNEIEVVVHSGASLMKHSEIYRSVRTGTSPIGEMFMGLKGNDDPIFKADNIPFLASDFDSAKKLWDASRPYVEKSLAKDGVQLLFAVPWPPQGLYSKDAINSVADMKGKRMRSYSPTLSRLGVLMSAEPTTVATPEIPQAFSTGIIDTMITSPSTGVSSQAWDFVSYYTDVQAWIPKNMVVVNAKVFKRLPEKLQKAVLDSAAKAEARGWEMAKTETEVKTAALKENGMNVSKPTPELQKGLQDIGDTMGKEWAEEVGDAGQAVLKAL